MKEQKRDDDGWKDQCCVVWAAIWNTWLHKQSPHLCYKLQRNATVLHVRLEMISEYLPILTCGFCLLANHRAQLPGDPADRHQQAWSQSHWPQVKGSLIIITPGIRIGYVLAAALVNLLSRCSSFDDLCVCRTSWPLTPSPRSPTGAAGTPISTSPSATWSEEANCCVRPHWWVPAMNTWTHTHFCSMFDLLRVQVLELGVRGLEGGALLRYEYSQWKSCGCFIHTALFNPVMHEWWQPQSGFFS